MLASDVYKLKVSDDAFVFCLDTIKADEEYKRFSEEFCKRGQGVDAYLYLSSYQVYLPVKMQYVCDTGFWYCNRGRNILTFIVNKDNNWLVEDELYLNLNQSSIDSILKSYYSELKKYKKTSAALIDFKIQSIKNNKERDSLYVSLLSSYYNFIKKEKQLNGERIEKLLMEFPFNLSFGEYIILPPPPPPPIYYEIIGIEEDIESLLAHKKTPLY